MRFSFHNSFLYVLDHGGPEVLCSSNACFNSLMTGVSSGGQLCSHVGFWDDDSLILENDAVMECQFLSVIPVFSNVGWYFFSLLWPTNQNGGFESLHGRVLRSSLLKLWQSLVTDLDRVKGVHRFQF